MRAVLVVALIGAALGAAGGWSAYAYAGVGEDWLTQRVVQAVVTDHERVDDRLVVTLQNRHEVFVATFRERADDVERVMLEGARVRLRLRHDQPFADDPDVLQIRPAGVVTSRRDPEPPPSEPTPPAGGESTQPVATATPDEGAETPPADGDGGAVEPDAAPVGDAQSASAGASAGAPAGAQPGSSTAPATPSAAPAPSVAAPAPATGSEARPRPVPTAAGTPAPTPSPGVGARSDERPRPQATADEDRAERRQEVLRRGGILPS